jgi:hypothetical protein
MRYSNDILDEFYAPSISKLVECKAPDLTGQHEEAKYWIANNFLNSVVSNMFGRTIKNQYKQYFINLLFRTQVAFADYHEGRSLTIEFIQKSSSGNPAVQKYFQAVSRWESCLLNLQMFMDIYNKLNKFRGTNELAFNEKDSSSSEYRLYKMANTVKHWGERISNNIHEYRHTIPLWIINDGLSCNSYSISYIELSEIISSVALAADEICISYGYKPSKGSLKII